MAVNVSLVSLYVFILFSNHACEAVVSSDLMRVPGAPRFLHDTSELQLPPRRVHALVQYRQVDRYFSSQRKARGRKGASWQVQPEGGTLAVYTSMWALLLCFHGPLSRCCLYLQVA